MPSNDPGMPVGLGVLVVGAEGVCFGVDDVGLGRFGEDDGVAVGTGGNDGAIVDFADVAAVPRGRSTR